MEQQKILVVLHSKYVKNLNLSFHLHCFHFASSYCYLLTRLLQSVSLLILPRCPTQSKYQHNNLSVPLKNRSQTMSFLCSKPSDDFPFHPSKSQHARCPKAPSSSHFQPPSSSPALLQPLSCSLDPARHSYLKILAPAVLSAWNVLLPITCTACSLTSSGHC